MKRRGRLLRGMAIGLVPLSLLAAGGVLITGPRMSQMLQRDAEAALKSAGQAWAHVSVRGRDVEISGAAPSHAAVEAAVKTAAAVKGVRRAVAKDVQVRLAMPTVRPISVNAAPLKLSGTWPENRGATLSVRVAGHSYALGRDAALSSNGAGRWTLVLKDLPPEGVHDVVVTVRDGEATARDATHDELVIDTTPPQPATLDKVEIDRKAGRLLLTGRWPAEDAKALVVGLDDRRYVLGRDAALATEDGRWTLRLRPLPPDGVHAVSITVADALGNTRTTTFAKAVVLDTTPPDAGALRIDAARADEAGHVRIEGRWPVKDAVSLVARLGDKRYETGRDAALVAMPDGRFVLEPKETLAPGSYDLVLTAKDAAGNATTKTFAAAVRVPAPKPSPAPEKPKDTTPPAAPTIMASATNERMPVIRGTWPSSDAKALEVELDGRVYQLGRDPELRADGDHWALTPARPLKDGRHEVIARVRDAAGNTASAKGAFTVDATSPAAPTVKPLATVEKRVVLHGTWPEGDAVSLTVSVAGHTFTLGKDAALARDGEGRWRLTLPSPLAPGAYDVVVTVKDAMGNASRDQTRQELLVKAPPKVTDAAKAEAAAKAAQAARLSCQKQVDALLKSARILFESDSDKLKPESMALIAQLARLLNACPKTEVVIAGHTDSQGSESYNQALSERRAAAVARALAAQGVSVDRLSVIGFGESRPVADNATEEGRARNRRIEFYVRPRP